MAQPSCRIRGRVPASPRADYQEDELAQRIPRFGDIAQVFSTYQKRNWGSAELLGQGVNTIVLRHHDGRRRVAGIGWDEESGAGALSARYLPR